MTGASDILELIDTAQPFAPQAAEIDAGAMRAFGMVQLEGALAGLGAGAGGPKEAATLISTAAERIGTLTGAGALHRPMAIARIEQAARTAGLIGEGALGLAEALQLIHDGIARGELTPFDASDARRAAAPGKASRTRASAADRMSSPSDPSPLSPSPASTPQGESAQPSQPSPLAGGQGDTNLRGETPQVKRRNHPENSSVDGSAAFPRSGASPCPSSSGEEAGETLAKNADYNKSGDFQQSLNAGGDDDAESDDDGEGFDGDDGEGNGEDPPDHDIDPETFRACALLDQSDVDNGKRLLAYFGEDLLVRQEDDVESGQKLAWTGTHWDLSGGEALAHLIGQKVGDLIKVEAGYIDYTPAEQAAVDDGKAAVRRLKSMPPPETMADKLAYAAIENVVEKGDKAQQARSKRRQARKKWGISTKNAGRIGAMLRCAAPHLRRHPDAFNADPLKFATLTHTLRFVQEIDADNPDPDGVRPLVDATTGRPRWRLEVTEGHNRDDMITAVIPFAYDPKATAPDFAKFLDLFQPEPKKRKTVQQFTGMSLTAQPVQRIMFHTGTGGNGKSVFLEVISRVLGDGLAVGLPAESVSGEAHNNPSAPTPDVARCYAKRFIRVSELPKDQPVKAEMVKRLTGGEKWPVRTMYKGYFEFKPTGKPHMSGNGEPKLDGADGGLRRRFIIVPWSVTLPPEKHRDFEDVVREIVEGGSGILNWLIEGALSFLNDGLEIAEDVAAATAAHFAEMDPVQRFIDVHVQPDPGGDGVQARAMWLGWKAFAEANGMGVRNETWFGRLMKSKLEQNDPKSRVRIYVNVKLVDLPDPHHQSGPPDYAPGEEVF